jgi:hypothetical protein
MSQYQILRRGLIKKKPEVWENDLTKYNFNTPLCGFSDYNEKITVGDIVGVLLKSSIGKKVKFRAGKLQEQDLNPLVEPVYGSYYQEEEHFFQITKVNKTSTKFVVRPVFIDGKIIRKEINENITKNVDIEINILSPFIQLVEIFIDGPSRNNQKEIYQVVFDHRIKYILNNVNEIPKLKIHYHDYKNTLFDIWNEEYMDDMSKLIDYYTLQFPEKVELIGTIELINENMKKIYSSISDIKKINYDATFTYSQIALMTEPEISHNITKLKYLDIYRVYKPDPFTQLLRTREITNWSGIILPLDARSLVSTGNLLRFMLEGDRGSGCIYFTILHKISEARFLASVKNMYCVHFEDVVIIIDTGALHEIPTQWEENNSFAIYADITSGIGYTITGYREITDKEYININYDGLVFE